MTACEIQRIVHDVFSAWPLYSPDDHVQAIELPGAKEAWSIGYCSKFAGRPFTIDMMTAPAPPHLTQINVEGPIFYLLEIHVSPKDRGKGHGQRLYELCEKLAEKLGCTQIRQTPSGGNSQGSRMDYLVRRGWIQDGVEVFKELAQR